MRHPPRARLAFRVGVVGHRPDRLPTDTVGRDAIRARLAQTLLAVKEAVETFQQLPDAGLYEPGPPILRAISSLAEGTDRDFATAALDLDYQLCSPMAFSRTEFERDFAAGASLEAEGSVDRFHDILRRASAGPGLAAFELDGSRTDEGQAYGAAGRLVLNQSDLLVAVWDGAEPKGRGGTVDTLHEAVDFHVPVIWIDARAPYGWTLIRETDDLACLEGQTPCAPPWVDDDPAEDHRRLVDGLREIVLRELGLPGASAEDDSTREARLHATAYFKERKPIANFAIFWKLFRDLVGSSTFRAPSFRVPDFVSAIRESWPVSASEAGAGRTPPIVAPWVNGQLRDHYAWADKRADLYADAHRGGNVTNSLLAALAVLLALAPMAAALGERGERACIWGELAVLAMIVSTVLCGHFRRWRERWLEYRVLAELIRQLRVMIPLGGGRPLPRTPAHLAIYGDPAASWMYWHVRALARATGIPPARVNNEYTLACLDDLSEMIDGPTQGQLRFHESNHVRSERINHRLHGAALVLFILTILAIFSHLLVAYWDSDLLVARWGSRFGSIRIDPKPIVRWLILISAVAPAGGAALANINNQGEFGRLAKRSRAMADGFKRFKARVIEYRGALRAGEPPPLGKVTDLANQMTSMMVEENVEWRVVVLDLAQSAS